MSLSLPSFCTICSPSLLDGHFLSLNQALVSFFTSLALRRRRNQRTSDSATNILSRCRKAEYFKQYPFFNCYCNCSGWSRFLQISATHFFGILDPNHLPVYLLSRTAKYRTISTHIFISRDVQILTQRSFSHA